MEKAKKVEEQNIDPELEYDVALAHAEHNIHKAKHAKKKPDME